MLTDIQLQIAKDKVEVKFEKLKAEEDDLRLKVAPKREKLKRPKSPPSPEDNRRFFKVSSEKQELSLMKIKLDEYKARVFEVEKLKKELEEIESFALSALKF